MGGRSQAIYSPLWTNPRGVASSCGTAWLSTRAPTAVQSRHSLKRCPVLRVSGQEPVVQAPLEIIIAGTPADDDPRDCACECVGLTITFYPGGDKFEPGFYEVGTDLRFGIVIIATWKVEGDPAKCRYYGKEPDGGLTRIKGPGGEKPDTKGSKNEDWGAVPNPWWGMTGFFAEGPGEYRIKYRLTQSYKCVSSDGSEMTVGPRRYRKLVKKSWP